MKKLLSRIAGKYLNESLDFRAQVFNLLAIIGMVLGVVVALSCVATNAGIVNVAFNLLASVLAFALLTYANSTGQYRRCYLITVTAVFLIAFPVLFFTAGGYHSGMPAFFVFAIVFTVFMLKDKTMYVMVALEALLYVGVCLFAYRYPGTVTFLETERAIVLDIVIGFTTSSAALGLAAFRHTRIYDQKQMELAKANDALKQVDRMKTEFLGNISHELKTPLTVVSGNIQSIREKLPDRSGLEDVDRAMRLIDAETARMAVMVSQLLDVSRIDEGRMVMERKPESVVRIIQSTLDDYYPFSAKNHNTLAFHKAGDIPPVHCDRCRVAQVLLNLVTNAARHTHHGKITVSVQAAGGHVIVTVADNGEGIIPERIPHLFERYYSREPSKEKASAGGNTGTGLGLYICKYIVEAHGGEITLRSAPGNGTSVSFTLPYV